MLCTREELFQFVLVLDDLSVLRSHFSRYVRQTVGSCLPRLPIGDRFILQGADFLLNLDKCLRGGRIRRTRRRTCRLGQGRRRRDLELGSGNMRGVGFSRFRCLRIDRSTCRFSFAAFLQILEPHFHRCQLMLDLGEALAIGSCGSDISHYHELLRDAIARPYADSALPGKHYAAVIVYMILTPDGEATYNVGK